MSHVLPSGDAGKKEGLSVHADQVVPRSILQLSVLSTLHAHRKTMLHPLLLLYKNSSTRLFTEVTNAMTLSHMTSDWCCHLHLEEMLEVYPPPLWTHGQSSENGKVQ